MAFSSPSPSGEGGSSSSSPDTRLTAPSPNDQIKPSNGMTKRNVSINNKEFEDSKQIVQFRPDEQRDSAKDPFVTPGRASKSGLSPTASAFSPFPIVAENFNHQEINMPVNLPSENIGMSRYLKILGDDPITPNHVKSWLQELENDTEEFHGATRITERNGSIGIFFEDIRDAWRFQCQTNSTKIDWQAIHDTSADIHPLPRDSAQLVVYVAVPPGSATSPPQLHAEVMAALQAHGKIFSFTKAIAYRDGSFKGIVEYCNVLAAKAALVEEHTLEGQSGIKIVLTSYSDENSTATTNSAQIRDPHVSSVGPGWEYGLPHSNQSSITQANLCLDTPIGMYPMMARSSYSPNFPYLVNSFITSAPGAEVTPLSTPISPSYQRVSAAYRKPPSPALTVNNGFSPSRPNSAYGRLDRRQHAARVSRNSFQSPSSHHNHVDVHRIREGIDVRTTIMLRNIPNKVDQAMLKRIVDESSWGKYDFMYLRIDFANDCNVGYAFINFVDPLDIVDFVEARGNQRWNCFKSDKVAEVSYATIQGKDCLVQKFRNSSVMLEAAHYRPKLYFTSNGPMPEMAGQEEQFPEPDNQSKMKRSCENAEHVGLFTPNAGQHFRDEQRRRRSQYDRGTRLAALEEYDLEAIQHLYIGNERTE
ncbi:hypothetical protein NLG97_g168 [Lecanicillium saksenae]|uniref:Uncharacterized protein n=1 Tax=Lecanicillium saksenae TaxID=468837 RepID=A0ACC1R8P3_9HYPO|nr:hypothetical protein NLG97_g168 [Lecanicillium saksenae]